jgi:diacylglycerol kinase (ATP)
VLAALGVLLVGLVVPFDAVSKAIILLCIGLVLFSEILNTAMEAIVDLYTGETHKLAQIAKDAAAGGVMVLALCAAFVFFVVLRTHEIEIRNVHHLVEKGVLVAVIVVLEASCLFGIRTVLWRLLAQGSSLAGLLVLAAIANEPVFSVAAFLLMALIAFAPMIHRKNEAK